LVIIIVTNFAVLNILTKRSVTNKLPQQHLHASVESIVTEILPSRMFIERLRSY